MKISHEGSIKLEIKRTDTTKSDSKISYLRSMSFFLLLNTNTIQISQNSWYEFFKSLFSNLVQNNFQTYQTKVYSKIQIEPIVPTRSVQK